VRTARRALVALLVAVTFASACGDSGNGNTTTGGSQGTSAPGTTAKAPTGEPIVFGLDEDSTGPGASYSTIAGKTIRDAVDEINNNGGILGRPVKIVVENDESDPTKTPAIIRKLVDQGANALFVQTGGSAVVQAKPVVQQSQIIAVAPTTLTTSVAQPPDAEYMYILANPIDDFSKIFCAAWQKVGIKKLAILADGSATIDGLNKLLVPELQKCVDVVAQEKADVNASDVTPQVSRVKSSNPDAVLVTTVGGNFEVLVQNTLFTQMPKTQRFSLASIGNQPSAWKLANAGALDGLVYMASITMDNQLTKQLNDFLVSKRGKDFVMTAYDAQAYDSVQLVKMAIEKAGGVTDKAKLRDAMNSISGYKSHFGQPGFTLSYSASKHVGTDGLCGLILGTFGKDNKPGSPWSEYQPKC
jgi:branched-chain amino acid transport system substrate-binding protein